VPPAPADAAPPCGALPGVALPDAELVRELAAVVAASTTRDVAVMRSLATDFPAAAAPLSTPIALFINPIVSAIVDALTLPARSFSSTASAKRPSGFVPAAAADRTA
jgi:hypothetical protein